MGQRAAKAVDGPGLFIPNVAFAIWPLAPDHGTRCHICICVNNEPQLVCRLRHKQLVAVVAKARSGVGTTVAALLHGFFHAGAVARL